LQRPGTLAARSPIDFAHGDPERVEGSSLGATFDPEPVEEAQAPQSASGNDPDSRRSTPARPKRSQSPAPSSFPKERRLRRRAEFGAVFDAGTRQHGRFLTILFRESSGSSPRLGIVASKKLGGAVERNRAKRLIREVFRRFVFSTGGVDLVVIPRRELLTAEFAHIVKDFSNTWRRGLERLTATRRG
jgi:ribonuclease P protein component